MRKYYRQFITLLQERQGYAMPNRQAAGRIVIEARDDIARATVYIQDLSPQNTYKLTFVHRAGDVNLGVALGLIIVDEKGRYEGKFEFDRDKIGGAPIACESIDACAIVAAGEDDALTAPLVGYRGAPFSWRVNLSFHDGKVESPIVQVKEIMEEVPPSVYDFEMPDAPQEAPPEIMQAAHEGEISQLFSSEEAVEIFDEPDGLRSVQWIVTTLQKVGAVGLVEDEIIQNPDVLGCFNRHKHILLGKREDEGCATYILGIPDIYDTGDDKSASGQELHTIFSSFKLCNPDDPIKGAHGYWLKELQSL